MANPSAATDLSEACRLLLADVYELAGTSRASSEALARDVGQTNARWNLLSVVSDGPRSAASAARRLGLARQSVQRVADDLIAGGDLRREADPDDARAPLLVITDAGRKVLDASIEVSDGARTRLLQRAGVTTEDLGRARAVLRRLIDAHG